MKTKRTTTACLSALVLIVWSSVASCAKETLGALDDIPMHDVWPTVLHRPARLDGEPLRVFSVGNSFTSGPTAYIPELADSARIAPEGWALYGVTAPSASLRYWWDALSNDTPLECAYRYGHHSMRAEGTLRELLAQPWDVITFQQVSSLSDKYSSFAPDLDRLVRAARELCTNPDVRIAWQQTWSYDDGFNKNKHCEPMYEAIAWASARLLTDGRVDFVIPTGTAIQNARHTSLNTPHNLTRDGSHLGEGVGLYVAACTWYEALFVPAFGGSVLGNTAVRTVGDAEREGSAYETVDVTDRNRALCQQCALAAIVSPFEITNVEQ